MEDVEMAARVRKRARLDRLDAPLVTSPRRYRARGRWRGWLRNTALITLHRLGVPPRILARFYSPNTEVGDGSWARTLIVFAKAPRPGRVKTRLAADLGAEDAAELYRVLGRRVVDGVRGGAYRLVVSYAPSGARDEVAAWLGEDEAVFRAQRGRDLGERLEAAVRRAFRDSERVCVIGTDAPDVDRALVEEAFRVLDDHPVVVGPARDGGYYLLGLRRMVPRLFRDVPWSTDRALEVTLERIREAGLDHALLPPLSDVDTLADVPADLL